MMQTANSQYCVLGPPETSTSWEALNGLQRSYPFLEWHRLIGATVDVRREGQFVRTGLVEAAMASGDTAWIAADGIEARTMIEKCSGYELWISPEQLQYRRVHQPRV